MVYVLRKEDYDWVKKCVEYEVEESQTKRKAKEYLERGCGKGLSSM